MSEPKEKSAQGNVILGFFLVLALHVIVLGVFSIALNSVSSDAWFLAILFIGISQLTYVIPGVIVAKRRGFPATAKGMGIAAALPFLLNAACFGYVAIGDFVF